MVVCTTRGAAPRSDTRCWLHAEGLGSSITLRHHVWLHCHVREVFVQTLTSGPRLNIFCLTCAFECIFREVHHRLLVQIHVLTEPQVTRVIISTLSALGSKLFDALEKVWSR